MTESVLRARRRWALRLAAGDLQQQLVAGATAAGEKIASRLRAQPCGFQRGATCV